MLECGEVAPPQKDTLGQASTLKVGQIKLSYSLNKAAKKYVQINNKGEERLMCWVRRNELNLYEGAHMQTLTLRQLFLH